MTPTPLIASGLADDMPGEDSPFPKVEGRVNPVYWATLRGMTARHLGAAGLVDPQAVNPYAPGTPEHRVFAHAYETGHPRPATAASGPKARRGGSGALARQCGGQGRGRARKRGADGQAIAGDRAEWPEADLAVLALYLRGQAAGDDGVLPAAFFAALFGRSLQAVEVKLSKMRAGTRGGKTRRKVARETPAPEGGAS